MHFILNKISKYLKIKTKSTGLKKKFLTEGMS